MRCQRQRVRLCRVRTVQCAQTSESEHYIYVVFLESKARVAHKHTQKLAHKCVRPAPRGARGVCHTLSSLTQRGAPPPVRARAHGTSSRHTVSS